MSYSTLLSGTAVTDTSGMFYTTSSLNVNISGWDVSQAIDMSQVFHNATSFEQNLGDWYIVLDGATVSDADDVLIISAQNAYPAGQSPTYEADETAANGDRFQIVDSTRLATSANRTVAPGNYTVTVESTGSFGTDNSRTVEIAVDRGTSPPPGNLPIFEAGDTQTVPEGPAAVPAPANRPPAADAGADQTVSANATVTLDGSGSGDPDNGRLAYSCSQTSGAPTVEISDGAAANPTFVAPAGPATSVCTLTVTDAGSLTDTDTVTVSAPAKANAAPTTAPPARPQEVTAGLHPWNLPATKGRPDPQPTAAHLYATTSLSGPTQ